MHPVLPGQGGCLVFEFEEDSLEQRGWRSSEASREGRELLVVADEQQELSLVQKQLRHLCVRSIASLVQDHALHFGSQARSSCLAQPMRRGCNGR
eukprot:1983053-Rhodomonas_salina.2